jgi:pyruvate dehydrogenase E2 component (dihydrolipoamide acetyltransferase)
MPKIGQAMAEGTVIQWHWKNGDRVEAGVILVTIETDKATYELEAPASGVLHIYVNEGQEVAVGTVIAEIGEASQRRGTAPVSVPPAAPAAGAAKAPGRKKVLASPKAKQLAAEHGIDLSTLTPSGADGVISAGDVEQVIAAKRPTVAPPLVPVAKTGSQRAIRERRNLTGIKKTSARRLQEAWQIIPHIVQMVEVDAVALLATQTALKAEIPSLTLNDVILHAAVQVMTAQPDLNGTIEGDALVLYEGVDIGFAVDTPRGLVVPVIRRADTLSISELATESQRLIEAARSGRLGPDDIGSASLTVSNLGMFGIRAGTPVINLGEPILIFVGAVEDRAVVRDGQVIARPMLTLSIAYDHRITDGVAAARFTQGLKEKLEGRESAVSSQQSAVSGQRSAVTAAVLQEASLSKRAARTMSEGTGYAVQVHSSRHSWTLDEPIPDGGTDAGPDPVTAFLGALLSCMTIAFKAAARRRNVTIERLAGRVHATPEGQVKEITMTLEVWSPDSQDNVRALLDRAKRGCYVSGVLKPEVDFILTLVVHSMTKPTLSRVI